MADYIRDPAEITRRSFAILGEEAGLDALPEAMRPVAARLVHTAGMTDIVPDLAWSEGAAEAGRAALLGGAPVICDVAMVGAGVLRRRLPAGNEVLVGIEAEGVAARAEAAGITRSAAGMEALQDRLGGAIVAIGNAPTALFRLLELVEEGAPRPALVLGFPVGFVGAAEAKAALSESGLPFVTLHGRRGGAAMAAAAVNALVLGEEVYAPPEPAAREAEKRGDPRWLSVIGIGEDGLPGLSPVARALVAEAEVLIGGARHLRLIGEGGSAARERLAWPSPMSDLVRRIPAMRGRRVAVLATGDPFCYGVGAMLARHVPFAEMIVVPAPSAFALASARLGWPQEEVACLSLHGRPVGTLAAHVAPGARLLLLAEEETPGNVAEWLVAHGFGESRMIALAHMGGMREARFEGSAAGWSYTVPAFHTLGLECVAGPGARWLPVTAGLPDDAFEHDGKMTKREARAAALARLMPHPGALLWDIGAGAGSVAIEWMRAAKGARAVAVEPRAERRERIARNALALGVPGLGIHDGRAPDALQTLPGAPDAIFLGGGLSREAAEAAAARLGPGGRLVAHAVTLESEALLLALFSERGGELTRLMVERASPVGAFQAWRPAMPVVEWSWAKP